MILKLATKSVFQTTSNFQFASAASAIDYYSLLGIQRGATNTEIKAAFRKITETVNPESNPAVFGRLNEAFVILMDHKARDAYDSLIRTRTVSLGDFNRSHTPAVHSYIAERKADKEKEFSKENNIDRFGRYKGGVPRKNITKARGSAKEAPGTLYNSSDSYNTDKAPEYSYVDTEKAESFKNFHQDEREFRNMKPTWTSLEVDYHYFIPKAYTFNLRMWRYFIILLICLPILAEYQIGFSKRYLLNDVQKKRQEKFEKAEKAAKEQERLAQEKIAQEQAQSQENSSQ